MKAAIVDCLSVDSAVRREDVLKAYQCISRVSRADDLLIVQPYARWLFRQGPMAGPHLLMEYLRGKLSDEELKRQWEKAVQKRDVSQLTSLPCRVDGI